MKDFLRMLCSSRGITMGELLARLGYASRTSFARLEKGEVSPRAIETFRSRVRAGLSLSEEESRELEEVLDRLYWQDDYGATREMRLLLSGKMMQEDGDFRVTLLPEDREVTLWEHFEGAVDPEIVLINAGDAAIFSWLLYMLRERGARVRHYVRMPWNAEPILRSARAILALSFEKNYDCLAEERPMKPGLAGADLLNITWRKEGETNRRRESIIFENASHGFLIDGVGIAAYLGRKRYRRRDMIPVKNRFLTEETDPRGRYQSFLKSCRDLEMGADILKMKPDISLEWVPPEIQKAALLQGPACELNAEPAVIDQVISIERQRFDNVFAGQKRIVTLLNRGAMREFAITGRARDHFYGMRPYTREERVQILKTLLNACETVRGFDVRFHRGETEPEIYATRFEGKGLLLFNARTDYNLEESYGEVLLVNEEIQRLFAEYFNRALLPRSAASREESQAILKSLIALAETEEGRFTQGGE